MQSTTYYLQMDGHTDVVNQRFEAYLYCFTMATLAKWAKWIAWIEFNYNTSTIQPYK